MARSGLEERSCRPAIRAAAPEFYDHLESSPGFYSTIWRWLGEGHMWTYACVSTGAAAGEQERGLLRAAE